MQSGKFLLSVHFSPWLQEFLIFQNLGKVHSLVSFFHNIFSPLSHYSSQTTTSNHTITFLYENLLGYFLTIICRSLYCPYRTATPWHDNIMISYSQHLAEYLFLNKRKLIHEGLIKHHICYFMILVTYRYSVISFIFRYGP